MQQAYPSERFQSLLYTPQGYSRDGPATWPLILFLHGSGERGRDLTLVRKFGLPKQLDGRDDFPALVLSPQCPNDVRWTDLGQELMALLEAFIDHQPVDRARLYLTGFSMGGQGAWHLAVAYPTIFTAVAPVAGRIPPQPNFLTRLCALKQTPVWVFHGDKDELVPPVNSRTMAQTLEKCGGNVQLTVYPELGHGPTCDAAYQEERLYCWLFAQRKDDDVRMTI
jgi:predicted peptidase